MHLPTLIQLFILSSAVLAYNDQHLPKREESVARRALAAERHLRARACSSKITEFTGRRKARRALLKRSLKKRCPEHSSSSDYPYETASFTVASPDPQETGVRSNCVASPEIQEGHYFIQNELVRWNLTEDQPGVPLIMDFGVLDISTCGPMADVFVEVWSANATGVYSGYPRLIPNNITDFNSSFVPEEPSANLSSVPCPRPSSSDEDPFDASNFDIPPPLERNETFLRGGMPTNEEGIVELYTIYPGYYPDRAPHVNAMFHDDWKMSPNGTIISRAGNNLHTGQLFFPESWNDDVLSLDTYSNWEYLRVLNVDDEVLNLLDETDQSSAFFDLEMIGETVEEGFFAYVTVLLDPSRVVPINSTNFFNSTDDLDEPPVEEEDEGLFTGFSILPSESESDEFTASSEPTDEPGDGWEFTVASEPTDNLNSGNGWEFTAASEPTSDNNEELTGASQPTSIIGSY